MRIDLKLVAALWAAVCNFVAFWAAAQFWVTYAVPADRPYERAVEDVALMYRAAGALAPASYIAAAMLAINAFVIVLLVWTRPRV